MNLKILSLKCLFEQRVQRNQNINSAEKFFVDFLSRKSKAIYGVKRKEYLR